MKRIKGFAFLCILAFLTVSLTGCGGDSSTPESAKFFLISGVVEDGPIENARVSLRDKENKSLVESSTLTDSNGDFSLQVPVGMDLVGVSVVAVGGIDRATRIDFTGMEMRSPLALFKGDVTKIVVSPLTTLIAELQDQNISFENAESLLRNWLTLSPEFNLVAEPHTNLDLLRRTLLLTQIAREVKSRTPTANPFVAIAENVAKQVPLFATQTTCNIDTLKALNLTPDAQTRISEMQALLSEALTIEDAAAILKQKELMDLFSASVKIILNDDGVFAELKNNPIYKENLELLAKVTLNAAGSDVIILGGPISQRITRYVVVIHQLHTSVIWADSANFEKKLAAIETDPLITELARNGFLNTEDRLFAPLGDDNWKRHTYYFISNHSHYFQAEQLIKQVFDDAINDAVQLKIIEGKATDDLIDETRAIIADQIIQSEPKANAYRALANALIKSHRPQEALEFLEFARDLYRKVIATKGEASASATDVANLLTTASLYRKAGDLLNAESLLGDIAAIAQALASDAIIYGKLITGIKNVADAYIADGDLEAATPLIEKMDHYSGLTPPYLGTYKLRIFNWSETAKRYADLGNGTKVVEVFYKIQELRKVEGSVEATYWGPVVSLVESLYRVGARGEALDLADTIPGGTTDQSKAFKLVATYEALQGFMDTAFSIVDNSSYVPKDEDRIDLLTYFNSSRPYIGQVLINNGRFNEARQALEKAKDILDGMTLSNNLDRISNGYVRVAELYAQMADVDKAKELLQSAQKAIADDPYVVTALADIALGYHNHEETVTALTLLDDAKRLADADPAHYRANVTPGLGAEEYAAQLYEKLVKSYEEVGDNLGVRSTALSFQSWAQQIHTAGTVNDALAVKECDYLLRAALYLDRAGYHSDALNAVTAAQESSRQIAVVATQLKKFLNIITTYAVVHEYEKALALALSLEFTSERNQAIQTLANAYIDRDDFPDTWVASIDSDGDGMPDFFNPLASTEEIAASGLIMDDDSDGDGILDSQDFRPLFDDRL
ncbi:MAG: hypothetical protein IBX46_03740 [Desulfuromonadales bacterium]|nr:hypothetical protein [Desulfuromonadales bacterium]